MREDSLKLFMFGQQVRDAVEFHLHLLGTAVLAGDVEERAGVRRHDAAGAHVFSSTGEVAVDVCWTSPLDLQRSPKRGRAAAPPSPETTLNLQ
jgi:hypothetical protein